MSDSICPSISQGFANWVVFLSLLPNNAVQVGAIALSAIVTAVHLVNACRAMSLDGRIEITLRNVEADVQDAIKHHILRESDACGDSTVESSLKTVQLRAAKLRRITFRTSTSPWEELKSIFNGHPLHLFMCLRAVWALENEVKTAKAEAQQRVYEA